MPNHAKAIYVIFLLSIKIALATQLAVVSAPLYQYDIDLNTIQEDRYRVSLNCQDFATDTLIFHFPWIIPGTYMEANYGKFIHDLKVSDGEGKPLKFKRKGKNTWVITPANQIARIEYWVSATWKRKNLRTIWPMAGTGIIPDRVFVINAGGVFGYFQGQESQAVNMTYQYPSDLYAMTVLDQKKEAPGVVRISTRDYHELIDSPIVFAYPDTTSFMVQETSVLVGFSHEVDDTRRAGELKAALTPSMEAIATYIDSLPADKYAYLIHYNDARPLGKILSNQRFMILKGLVYFLKHGIPMGGALEHKKSSFYYLPDPGGHYTAYVAETIEDIAIHEFMHILTPLNLHSEYIDDWNYSDPQLSRHLWLYEGITEYMSKIIQVNGGLESPKDFVLGTMRGKIRSGENFPFEEMSFTEMSSQVLEKPYKKEFLQVYQRGAAMGMLLDIEIIRLTEGRKRLIDVMLELAEDYGPSKPMPEASIFELFAEKVHPDLLFFFQKYIDGREALPYEQILAQVGIIYHPDSSLQQPRHPIRDLKVKNSNIGLGRQRTLKKVAKHQPIAFEKGDQYERSIYLDFYFDDLGKPWPEGQLIDLPIVRDGRKLNLMDTIRYVEKSVPHYMEIMRDMTPQQATYFNIWLGFEPPSL